MGCHSLFQVSSWPRDQTHVSCITDRFFTTRAPWEAFYLCVCVCSVAQSCPALCDPMNCSHPGSSVQGILQARIVEWVAVSYSRVLSLHEGKIYTFKCHSLENGLSCVFYPIGNIPLQKVPSLHAKHRQQRTKVRAKGIDAIWNQGYSSLLQYLFLICHFRHLFSLLQIRKSALLFLPLLPKKLEHNFLFIAKSSSLSWWHFLNKCWFFFPLEFDNCSIFICLVSSIAIIFSPNRSIKCLSVYLHIYQMQNLWFFSPSAV